MKEQKSQQFFNAIFSYIIDTFKIKQKSICDAYNHTASDGTEITITEASVSSWKTRNPPQANIIEDVYLALRSVLLKRIEYVSKPLLDFLQDTKAIFNAYKLSGVFSTIENSGGEYVDIILNILKAAYEDKHRLPAERNLEIAVTEVDNKEIKKLVVFDLDGTLIKGIKYSWTLLYQVANVPTEKCKIKKKEFENGEISYPEWVEFDCQELQAGGLTKEIAQTATKKNCSLTVNFREAIKKLKDNGCAVGIISGGADIVLYSLIPDADALFDGNIYINKLKFDDSGKLIDIEATPYDWDDDGKVRGVQGKNEGLKRLCKKYNLNFVDSVFVGDDDNDFKAMRLAGTKILYHSCAPNDKTYGTGSRKIPDGVRFVMENDLMLVADIILGENIDE